LKPNPAITEKNKVNTSLLAIEKSLGLNKFEEEPVTRRDLL
ncbi:terminase, partial [Staphylococcus pseudintermedius]|nr:terminase [Staphylococcus pseudintermedius]